MKEKTANLICASIFFFVLGSIPGLILGKYIATKDCEYREKETFKWFRESLEGEWYNEDGTEYTIKDADDLKYDDWNNI